ncbi:MAG: thioredoxin domain-containing protein [Dehalogenimonas sp.]|uniref:Thioredoxin domain-containing protein n=1 Tax=Candidatus Dehalogenimonas loeffleri TaxID=3127115 RepID=A0ABZ2J1J0_9CHLR|nr:thioredoxin domain-containing protein [Dehalogenimonas sp.]
MSNHLAGSSSPYLLQHADNPVDWYPWGDEALARAKQENKPILLSIGYSACHWCHVMAHESFENEATAALMNRHFINIKVDREERPDIDSIYMAAVQAMTGHGGWPLTAFLTPDGRPFYGGTYYPPEERHGLPAFSTILEAVAEAFRERPSEVESSAGKLLAAIEEKPADTAGAALSPDILNRAYQALQRAFDTKFAGFGGAPKFPQPLVLDFLLRYYLRSNTPRVLELVEQTLEAMYRGGIYDHLGGGFHRYAVDAEWQVPHFEKMLYDNALLPRVYLHAFQLTGKTEYRLVAEDIYDYVLREMTDPATGGFYSSQDADSEGEEGKFYIWTPDELKSVLGDGAAAFIQRFGVTEAGNFEERNILHLTGEFKADLITADQGNKEKLRRERETRIHPGKDTKVLVSWNAMMQSSLAEAGCVLGRDDYLAAAARNAGFILDNLRSGETLRHTSSVAEGFLEDYALLTDSLLWLHQATLNPRWLCQAVALADTMLDRFWDEDESVFYDTPAGMSGLFKRPRSFQDGAVPSGAASGALALLRLSRLTDDRRYWQTGGTALRGVAEYLGRYPLGFGQWLAALDFYLGPQQEVAVIGNTADSAARALANTVCRRYRPNTVLAALNPDDQEGLSDLPLFQDRTQINARPTAYVCRNFNCFPPVNTPEDLEQVLEL